MINFHCFARFVLIGILLICQSDLLGQKKFEVKLSFPETLSLTHLTIMVDQGFGRIDVPFKINKGNTIRILDYYYSEYAAIILDLPQPGKNMRYRKIFFAANKPASIRFLQSANGSSPFDHYKLEHVLDFKSESEELNQYIAGEVADFEAFFRENEKKVFDGNHPDLLSRFRELDQNIYKKAIHYIQENSNSYYSFWYFRSNAQYSGLSIDTLLSIYETTFPVYRTKSIEGNAYQQLLKGRTDVKKGKAAPGFRAKDVKGKTVDLESFRNKKFVLLVFWATWCGPCLTKMPLLSDLSQEYNNSLEIISIAYPTTLKNTMGVIRKKKMKWTNIYNDQALITSYGGMGAIPRLFLIDKKGTIIYDNQDPADQDLEMLFQKLRSEIKNE